MTEGPRRGGFLPIFLITMLLMITAYSIGVLNFAGDQVRRSMPGLPAWRSALFVLVLGINLICAIGIWQWRRWGLVGFVVAALGVLLVNASEGINLVLVIYAGLSPAMYSFFKSARTGGRGLDDEDWYGGGDFGGGGFSRGGGGGGFSGGGGGFGGGGAAGRW